MMILTFKTQRSAGFILIAQNPETREMLGYSETGEDYTGSVEGFKQRYRPYKEGEDGAFSTLEALKNDYQKYIDGELPVRVESKCAHLTTIREQKKKAVSAVVEAHGTTWQIGYNPDTGVNHKEELNDSVTLLTAAGGAIPGFYFTDINNVEHPADLSFLMVISLEAAAYRGALHRICSDLKAEARNLEPVPGALEKLQTINWPEDGDEED